MQIPVRVPAGWQRPLLLGVLLVVRALPARARRLLTGPPVVRDGRTLDPELQLVLRLQRLAGERPLETGADLARSRVDLRRQTTVIGGRQPIGAVRDLVLPTPTGERAGRLYVRRASGAVGAEPLLIWLHGGGWVNGDLDSADPLCRVLAERARVRVLSVDYRLAPEHPWPAAVDDAWAALSWAVEQAADLGADPTRVAVGGESAGGNLAAVLARRARDAGLVLAGQLLVYPAVDFVERRPSRHALGRGLFLEDPFMDFAEAAYLPVSADRGHQDASPLRADDLTGLAPAIVVTAGFDPLRDEGHEYAAALAGAGVPVQHWCEDAMPHGYASFTGAGRGTAAAIARVAAMLGTQLTRTSLQADQGREGGRWRTPG